MLPHPHWSFLAVVPVLLVAAPAAPAQVAPWLDPARVLVIYNTAWPDGDADGVPDSVEVAQHYATRRGVPAGNLLGLALTPASWWYDSSQWALFLTEMRDPLQAWLTAHGTDSVDTLLFCYGVPYQVNVPGFSFGGARSVDSSLCVPWKLGTAAAPAFSDLKYNQEYKEGSPGVLPDEGHFDHALYDFEGTPFYLHARLDGLTAEHAKALVDRAIYGQRHAAPTAYSGTVYVDSRFGPYADADLLAGYPFNYGTYEKADKQMAYGKFFGAASGFPTRWEPWETEIGEAGALFSDGGTAESAPDALFYGGWYNYAKYQHAWQWKAGAVACDLNSNSAQGLRDAGTVSFLCQAFQENLTAGAGVVAEPYLNGHNKPDVLLAYMLAGYPWAEVSMLSENGIKWMGLHVGDPLYRIDTAAAVADTVAPAPFAWVGADHASLELELPVVPADAPGGDEVFRITQLASGATPAVAALPVTQPDDRRLQRVAVPPTGLPGLTYVQAQAVDPSGHVGTTALLHFLAGPPAPSSAVVQVDDAAVGPGEPATFRVCFGAAGGLIGTATGFALRVTAPAYGAQDLPVEALFLSLAGNWLATRNIDQVDFSVSFAPGTLKPGPFTLEVELTANGQTSVSEATLTVSG
ncbi:MAG: TIGR03790 family protein [Planctomycetes bacterium]|nr:TIGR03790 family protein [Planctomycetota bacterium]